jgi:hypothetical protein
LQLEEHQRIWYFDIELSSLRPIRAMVTEWKAYRYGPEQIPRLQEVSWNSLSRCDAPPFINTPASGHHLGLRREQVDATVTHQGLKVTETLQQDTNHQHGVDIIRLVLGSERIIVSEAPIRLPYSEADISKYIAYAQEKTRSMVFRGYYAGNCSSRTRTSCDWTVRNLHLYLFDYC